MANRKSKIKKTCELAVKYIKNDTYENLSKLEEYARKNDICLCFDDEYVAVEDDIFYFNNKEL